MWTCYDFRDMCTGDMVTVRRGKEPRQLDGDVFYHEKLCFYHEKWWFGHGKLCFYHEKRCFGQEFQIRSAKDRDRPVKISDDDSPSKKGCA